MKVLTAGSKKVETYFLTFWSIIWLLSYLIVNFVVFLVIVIVLSVLIHLVECHGCSDFRLPLLSRLEKKKTFREF